MKAIIFTITALMLIACNCCHPEPAPQPQYSLVWQGQDSVVPQQIPTLCGSERYFRKKWRVSGNRLFGTYAPTIEPNPHPYSCQEQFLLDEGIFVLVNISTIVNQDKDIDSFRYSNICYKTLTVGPYDSCFWGGLAVRRYAITNGQLYDTIVLERYNFVNSQWRTERDSLFWP